MRFSIIAGAAAAAMFIGVPAQAQDAMVTLDRPCYSPGEVISETGSGFTPGGQVSETLTLLAPGGGFDALKTLRSPLITSDTQGAFLRLVRAAELARDIDRTETAISGFVDQVDPQGKSVSLQWTLSAWQVEIAAWANGEAKARKRMVIDTYGWTSAASTLYAHYYRGRKLVSDARIGALTGDCGDLRKRVKQFPFRNVKPGRWTVYFTGTRRHDKQEDPSIFFKLRVRK